MMNYFMVQVELNENFVAALTHDLRNPLSAVKMNAELMLALLGRETDAELKATLSRMTNKILENTKRVDRMVQDLLDNSLIKKGGSFRCA